MSIDLVPPSASRPLHVLIVPSWYPSFKFPFVGAFIRDQAAALAACEPSIRVTVWDWCPGLFPTSFKRPRSFLQALRSWRRRPATGWRDNDDAVHEYVHPVYQWPRPFRSNTGHLDRAAAEVIQAISVQRGPVHLLHAHVGDPAGWVVARAARARMLPWILTEHMEPFPFPDLMRRGQLAPRWRAVYRDCDALIAVSTAHAAEIRARTGRLPRVIPNVVNETFFSPGKVPPLAGAALFALGAHIARKGFDLLLLAYRQALEENILPPLRIGGEGPERGRFEALARHLGIDDRVSFLGPLSRERVRDEMRCCSAFVISSLAESFGVVAIEALACGRPVITTDCGGPRDVVTPDCGLIVRAGDPRALAKGLGDLARQWKTFDPHQIRASAVMRFGQTAIAGRLCELYAEVNNAKRTSSFA